MFVRGLFAAALPLLVFQFHWARTYGEPFPAIVMPSFAGTSQVTATIETTTHRLRVACGDGTSHEVDRNRFLDDAPTSHRSAIFALNFGAGVAVRPQHRDGLRAWTRARCAALTGCADPVSLTVERVSVTRTTGATPTLVEERVLDSHVLPL